MSTESRESDLNMNPQANAIGKNDHQTLGNLIRSFKLQDKPYNDQDDPWGGILSVVVFAIQSTYHTTLQGMPCQIVFGGDMILNVQHLIDWTVIKTFKQQLIHKNNEIENFRNSYFCSSGGVVMVSGSVVVVFNDVAVVAVLLDLFHGEAVVACWHVGGKNQERMQE